MSLAPYLWTGVAAAAAFRALVRPARAVFDQGDIAGCPGASKGCEPTLSIHSSRGVAPVYSVVTGLVSRFVPGSVLELVSSREPVVVSYRGPIEFEGPVAVGQRVRIGQRLGRATGIGLAISQITRLADGSLATVSLEPASWLASRGLRAATTLTPGTQWCQGGRTLVVPQDVARCGMRLPDPSGFSLLPVSVRLA